MPVQPVSQSLFGAHSYLLTVPQASQTHQHLHIICRCLVISKIGVVVPLRARSATWTLASALQAMTTAGPRDKVRKKRKRTIKVFLSS